ncbi:hypothetical protein NKG94_27340 [Micromonospora sp. M12]
MRSPQRRTVVLLADALRLAGVDRDRFVALARVERQPHDRAAVPDERVAMSGDRVAMSGDRAEVPHDRPAVVVPGNCPPPFRTWPVGRRSWNGSRQWPPTSPQGGRTPPRWWCCTGRRGSARPASPWPLDIGSVRPSPADSSSSTCRVPHRTGRSTRPRRWPDCCGRSGCRTAGCRCRRPSGWSVPHPHPGPAAAGGPGQRRKRGTGTPTAAGGRDASRWSPAGVH